MKLNEKELRLIEVFNDQENYPTLSDVGHELKIAYQTVRNNANTYRARCRHDDSLPKLIDRAAIYRQSVRKEQVSAREHAGRRADKLRADVLSLISATRYPIINPEAIVVEGQVSTVYDKITGHHVEKEGTPRTWLSATLRVEGVPDPRGRRFIFTGAQNDTEIHEGFWTNLQAYAGHLDADIVVGPWTYETHWSGENSATSRSYAEELAEFMCFGQMEIGDNFVFAGEMNTLPTASRPISDLTTYSRGRWGVFPHAKVQLKSVPSTDPRRQAHQVMTTGAVTRPKVNPRKAGIKSIFHHVIGAVLVEFDEEGDLFCRHLIADEDGSFYDLDLFVSNGEVSRHAGIKALVAADLHLRKLPSGNAGATFGFDPRTGAYVAGSIVEALQPAEILLHDIFDNETRSHHNAWENGYRHEMAYRGRDSVYDEVSDVGAFLERLQASVAGRAVIIESNHDLGLERWVREGRYRNDGPNIRFGLELELAWLEYRERLGDALDAEETTPSFSILEHAVRQLSPDLEVTWVHDNKSYLVGDVECGHHGFRGANGAKGTPIGFANMGRKMSIGDKHSPEIIDGVCVAGAMNLQQGYNKGPSSWATAHIVHYPNDKRVLVTLQNGKWRA